MTLVSLIRTRLRRHVPQQLRRLAAQLRRRASDARSPAKFAFTTVQENSAALADFICAIEVVQPIRRTAHFDGKMHNIALAVSRLNALCLGPSQAVSFWQAVGVPSPKNGFQLGRGIVGDRLSADVGGGLCQIASLLYELGLRGGCVVMERHPHSRDLYTEDNRFTPLGLDATVVWGFKDVRIGNPHPHRIVFAFDVNGETLRGRLYSEAPIPVLELELSRRDDGTIRTAEVRVRASDGHTASVSRDAYTIDPT